MKDLKEKLSFEGMIDSSAISINPPPAPTELMSDYYNRAESPVLQVPFSPIRRQQESEVQSLREELVSFKQQLENLKESHATLKEHNRRLTQMRMNLCIGNMLIEVAKSVVPQESGASTHVLVESMATMRDKDLRAANIPSKYWPYFYRFSKYVEGRSAAAHESEYEFATLLKMPGMESEYAKWAPLFARAYGKDVEEALEATMIDYNLE